MVDKMGQDPMKQFEAMFAGNRPNATEAGNAPQDKKEEGATGLPKKFPKGVVLGKDGKPCRSCTSFAAWAAMAGKDDATHKTALPSKLPADCPPDVEALGRASWTLLHSITAAYPEKPTPSDQASALSFVRNFGKLYPCTWCGEDFQRYMERERIRVSSRDEFGRWMCEAHNAVNEKLGKKKFDCDRWEERWRTGWKDGRCG